MASVVPLQGEQKGENVSDRSHLLPFTPLSIYLHWPYCGSLCPYCDFNSHVAETIDHAAWAAAYIRELDHWHPQVPDRAITSVFFGGGTPSLMMPETVGSVLSHIAARWPMAADCEITMEANPGSVEAAKFKAFAAAGINRVSIGIQSLRDDALQFLGRRHSRAEAVGALQIARDIFPRVSADFIYALSVQSVSDWETELAEILDFNLDHLSLYQLTLEPGTPFYHRAQRGEAMAANAEDSAQMFEITQSRCAAAGLPAYEISNHARPGVESRHNLAYWQYDDYLGIGPGAHGRVTLANQHANGQAHYTNGQAHKVATTTHRAPKIYLEKVAAQGHGLHAPKKLSRHDQLVEMLMMGLRLCTGIAKEKIAAYGGAPFDVIFPPEKLRPYLYEGLLWETPEAIGTTPLGAMKLNALTAKLLEGLG
jgi:oxygen-independent coproporphyrinogen-3 oxidase